GSGTFTDLCSLSTRLCQLGVVLLQQASSLGLSLFGSRDSALDRVAAQRERLLELRHHELADEVEQRAENDQYEDELHGVEADRVWLVCSQVGQFHVMTS